MDSSSYEKNGIRMRFGMRLKTVNYKHLALINAHLILMVKKILGRDDFTKIPNGGPMIEDRFSILIFRRGFKRENYR